jgi:RNA polymerase sigma factor (TIGR02999 family)
MAHQSEVTRLLQDWREGDARAIDRLMPLLHGELRRLARSHLRRERPDHTLQPTALLHEAYRRLVDQTNANWENRRQFFAVAAGMMRRILVDHARGRQREKRGGGATVGRDWTVAKAWLFNRLRENLT